MFSVCFRKWVLKDFSEGGAKKGQNNKLGRVVVGSFLISKEEFSPILDFHYSTSQLNGPSKQSKENTQNYNERTPLLLPTYKEKQQKLKNKKPPSIINCLWSLFRWEIIGAMIAKLFSDLLQITTPLLLG